FLARQLRIIPGSWTRRASAGLFEHEGKIMKRIFLSIAMVVTLLLGSLATPTTADARPWGYRGGYYGGYYRPAYRPYYSYPRYSYYGYPGYNTYYRGYGYPSYYYGNRGYYYGYPGYRYGYGSYPGYGYGGFRGGVYVY